MKAVAAPSAILVLGARVAPDGRATPLLAARIATAVEVARRWPDALVVACGGRAWFGLVEADVIARELAAQAIEATRVVRDRASRDTLENLREGMACVRARGRETPVAVVTNEWHLPRALFIARRLGIEAIGVAAPSPRVSLRRRLARTLRERLALVLDRARLGWT